MAEKEFDPKGLIANLKPGFIDLNTLYGVDVAAGTYTPHPDFANPKSTFREDILEGLSGVESPNGIQPIEIFVYKEAKVVVVDGEHRVINAIRNCAGDPDSPWARIRAFKFTGNARDAQIRQQILNLDEVRGAVTEAEKVCVVERFMGWGMTKEEIVEKVGGKNRRLVNKIEFILNASPEVRESIKEGVSIDTAAAIARDKPLDQQAAAAETAKAAVKKGASQREARKNAGVGVNRTKMLKLPEVRQLLWMDWDNARAMLEGTLAKDLEVLARVGAYLRVLQIPIADGEAHLEGVRPIPLNDVFEIVEPMYQDYLEKERQKEDRRR